MHLPTRYRKLTGTGTRQREGMPSVRAASLSLSRGLHRCCRRFWGPSRYINICLRPPQITSHQIAFTFSISLFIINRRLATIKSPDSSILPNNLSNTARRRCWPYSLQQLPTNGFLHTSTISIHCPGIPTALQPRLYVPLDERDYNSKVTGN